MTKEDINPLVAEFLTLHYSDNSNIEIAAHLNVIINAGKEEGDKVEILPSDVHRYGLSLGLRKSPDYRCNKRHHMEIHRKIDKANTNLSFYSGDPMDDIRIGENGKSHIIACETPRQITALRNAAYCYNVKYSESSGFYLKIFVDTERMFVLIEPERLCQPDFCRTHFSQSEGLCAPP